MELGMCVTTHSGDLLGFKRLITHLFVAKFHINQAFTAILNPPLKEDGSCGSA